MNIRTMNFLFLAMGCMSLSTAYSVVHPILSWKELGQKWGATLSTSSRATASESIRRVYAKSLSDSVTFYGMLDFDRVVAHKNLTCYGTAEFANASVQGVTTMYGPLHAYDSTFKDLDVRCSEKNCNDEITTHLQNCHVSNLLIQGKLETVRSKLNSVTAYKNELVFTDSSINTITVLNGSKHSAHKAVIELHNTQVDGSITFLQKGGTVICTGSSMVKGTIHGGVIERR